MALPEVVFGADEEQGGKERGQVRLADFLRMAASAISS